MVCAFVLCQFVDRILDGVTDRLLVGRRIAHDGLPLKAHVRRSVLGLQYQGLQASFVAKRVIGGIAEKIVYAFLPYARLNRLDDRRHTAMKFAGYIDGQGIRFSGIRGRGHDGAVWPSNEIATTILKALRSHRPEVAYNADRVLFQAVKHALRDSR